MSITEMASRRTERKQRQCWTTTRYFVKRTGSVCHVTINDKGEEHHTWLHANGTTACDCDSRNGKCYHREHVITAETARKEQIAAENDHTYAEAVGYADTNAKDIPGVTRDFTIEEYRAIMERDAAWQREQKAADVEKLRVVKAQSRVEARRRA